jgi:polar amino acid transport system substrate-binding protein
MKPYLYVLCCLVGLGSMMIKPAYAETLRVGLYPYSPLMIEESKTGVYYDILDRISTITGITFDVIFAPNVRQQVNFENNTIDIEAGINPAWRKMSTTPGLYTTPFSKAEDILLFKSEHDKQINSLSDLVGKQVGAVRGYTYPMFTSSFANEDIERINLKDGQSLLNFFAAGRIDYIIIDKTVAEYWMLNHTNHKEYEINYVVSSADIMLRVHPSKIQVLSKLNTAIKELVSSGEIEKIYAQYR